MTDTRIPATVLTGFLGAGKTTFVNYVLKEHHGKRLAVIENEFGQVGIDGGLVMQTKEEVIVMNNGCICCSVRDDLISGLKRLAQNRKGQFDAVVIETTGVADPGPVAQTFFVDEEVKKHFRLDAVVTFIDCFHIFAHLDEVKPEGCVNEAAAQVGFADVLVLNKTDLVDAAKLDEVKNRLRAINTGAKMVESRKSRVPIEEIFDLHAFDLGKTLENDSSFLNPDGAGVKHDKAVKSCGFVIEGDLDCEKFNQWLKVLLQEKGGDIFRSKGILAIAGYDDRFVFQGVHMLMSMGSSSDIGVNLDPWAPGETRQSKVCFIGKNLNKKELAEGLQQCLFDGTIPDPGPVPTQTLRFAVGTRVTINMGGSAWYPGAVVAHWYREPLWESGRYAPYQILLDPAPDHAPAHGDGHDHAHGNDGPHGGLIWAPADTDSFIREEAELDNIAKRLEGLQAQLNQ